MSSYNIDTTLDMSVTVDAHNSVFIRSTKYLNDKDAGLVPMFLSYADKIVPVCYQYCQTKLPNEVQNTEVIGYATNFRIIGSLDGSGDIMVCDVCLNKLSTLAYKNFQDVIDNYTVNIDQKDGNLVFALTRLIIYDKAFKDERDRQIIEHAKELESEEVE